LFCTQLCVFKINVQLWPHTQKGCRHAKNVWGTFELKKRLDIVRLSVCGQLNDGETIKISITIIKATKKAARHTDLKRHLFISVLEISIKVKAHIGDDVCVRDVKFLDVDEVGEKRDTPERWATIKACERLISVKNVKILIKPNEPQNHTAENIKNKGKQQ